MRKKINVVLILLAIGIFFYPSCDIVEAPYMVENNNTIDTSSVKRKVLIEEFTGHNCSGCPAAADELSSLQNVYENRVIGIAIHPTYLASQLSTFTVPQGSQGAFSYDFRTKWGDEIGDLIGPLPSGIPLGSVNRVGDLMGSSSSWGAVVQEELEKDAIFSIDIISNMISNSGTVSILIEALEDISEQHNVVICLTESKIINWQLIEGIGNVDDYEHNHVLRSLINTTLGDPINTSFIDGETWSEDYAIDISLLEQFNINYSNTLPAGNGNAGGWDINNMSVIAYIYNVANKHIVEVEEIHLIED